MNNQTWAISLVVATSLLSASGALLLKQGAGASLLRFRGLRINQRVIWGMALYAVASFLYIAALRAGSLSVLYPIVSLEYVWAVALGAWFLGESTNRFKFWGVGMIVVGVSLVGLGMGH